jgi:hypothetical protein
VNYLGAHTSPWPDPRRGPWWIRYHFAEVDGRAECVGLDLQSFRERRGRQEATTAAGPQPVTATLLRQLPVATLISEARRDQADLVEWASRAKEVGARARRAAGKQVPPFEQARRRGGRPRERGPEHFEAVAAVYSDALRLGDRPTKAVEQRWQVAASTAAKWVRQARRLGFLGPTTQGKAGGIAPPKRRLPSKGRRSTEARQGVSRGRRKR